MDVILLTVAMPAIATAIALLGRRLLKPGIARAFVPLAMCGGMWILGPMAMFVGAVPSGGGFATADPWPTLLILTALFPLTTISLSAHDGSLGGLLAISVILFILFLVGLAHAGSGGRRRGFDIREAAEVGH